MKIEIKKGPRPALKPVVRRSKYEDLRAAIRRLKPGQWFEIPGSAKFDQKLKVAVRNVVTSTVRRGGTSLFGIAVSETEADGALVVFSVADRT